MILERLEIEPFAGLADRKLELAEGLNVLLGPNEAGKSTLFQAVRHTLLTPAALKGRGSQKMLETFLPRGGGDSIACTLHFRHQGRAYRLAKRWGVNHSAELILPDGSRLRGEQPIRAVLADLLPAGEEIDRLRDVRIPDRFGCVDARHQESFCEVIRERRHSYPFFSQESCFTV